MGQELAFKLAAMEISGGPPPSESDNASGSDTSNGDTTDEDGDGKPDPNSVTMQVYGDGPSFNTLWQATKCAGYPLIGLGVDTKHDGVTPLYRTQKANDAYKNKAQVEAGYKNTEDYLRKKWLGGISEPQIK